MPVVINISGDTAEDTVREFRVLSKSFLHDVTPIVSGETGGMRGAPSSVAAEDNKVTTNTERPGDKPNSRTRRAAAPKDDAPKGNISTSPEDRKDPAVSEAGQAKDKADEQAESAGNKTAGTLKHDDIRGALGDYVKAFGMPAALEDGPKVLAMVLGDKPDKTDWKISEIPEDQDKLGKILGGIKEMTEKNPFKREAAKAA
jgi:hypothetical protein